MLPTGTFHLTGYAWQATSDDPKQASGFQLRVRSWPDLGEEQSISLAGKLRFRLAQIDRCTGYFDFEKSERFNCPESAPGQPKSQCERCQEREGFVPWMRCDGRDIPPLLPAVRAYVESPHYLYLANFGDDNVKVGMASEKRKANRLLDQGPLAAMYVAKGSGIAIRQLEVEVSRMGYTELMRRSRKIKLLTEGFERPRALELLHAAQGHVTKQADDEFASLWLAEPEPFICHPQAIAAREFAKLDTLEPKPEQIVDGEFKGASGSIAIMDEGGVMSALDFAELVGQVLEFNPAGEVQREAKQMGLFF